MRIKRIFFVCVIALICSVWMLLDLSADSSQPLAVTGKVPLEAVVSDNAELSLDENGDLVAVFRRVSPTLLMKGSFDDFRSQHNALRLVLENNSACNSLVVTYWYTGTNGAEQSRFHKIALGARGTRNDYYIYTDSVGEITKISLSFSGVSTGNIRLTSIEGVNIYNAEENSFGTVTSCVYNADKGKIEVGGNVTYDFVVRYRNARLVLYAADLEAESFTYGSVPLASISMSSHFDFEIPNVSLDDRMKGYVVAIIGESGEMLYALAPCVPVSEISLKVEESFIKGVHTDFGVLAARTNSDVAIVDVDFARLVSENVGEGLMYALGGRFFYFNRQYVSSLDDEIQRNYKNGMDVYLRLISSKETDNGLPGELARSSEEFFCLYAYAEFLCSRYNGASRGTVSGLIYGDCIDGVHFTDITLKEYTRSLADSLFVLWEVAASFERDIRLMVSISDRFETGRADVSPRVLLVSLGNALHQRYLGNISVALLVESTALSGEADRQGSLGFENADEISSFLQRLNATYPMILDEYLYSWAPSKTDDVELLKASLLHGYYTMANKKKVLGFVFSTASIRDAALVAELMDVWQLTDTDAGIRNSFLALGKLGAGSWEELIEGYSWDEMPSMLYRETVDPDVPPFTFVGEAYLWDFSQMGTNYGWSVGDGCLSLGMEKSEAFTRALAAVMLPSEENHYVSELMYRFDKERRFDTVDAVSFALQVEAPDGKYRVTIQVCGETVLGESMLELSANSLSKIYVDVADMFDEESILGVRVFCTPIGGSGAGEEYKLSIGNVVVHSTTQESEMLQDAIKLRQDSYIQNETTRRMEPIWIYMIVLLLLISVILIVVLYYRGEETKE